MKEQLTRTGHDVLKHEFLQTEAISETQNFKNGSANRLLVKMFIMRVFILIMY